MGRTVVLESCNEKTMFYLADSTARQIQRRLDSTLHTVLDKQTPATQRKVLACRTSFSLVHRRQWGANSHRADSHEAERLVIHRTVRKQVYNTAERYVTTEAVRWWLSTNKSVTQPRGTSPRRLSTTQPRGTSPRRL